MKNYGNRIKQIEKAVAEKYKDESEEENCLEKFRREAPIWLKEIMAMFFCLMTEFSDVELARDPQKHKIKDFDIVLMKEYCHIQEEVWSVIKALPEEAIEKVDRVKTKTEFQSMVTKSDKFSDQTKDDLLKILSSPHKESHNIDRKIWGLPPLEAERGGHWEFRGGNWIYDDGNRPSWNGDKWATVETPEA